MKIVLLTNKEQKDELIGNQQIDAECIWADDPGTLKNVKDADACIDLLFDDTPARVNELAQLKIPVVIINSVYKSPHPATHDWVRINGWNTFLKRPSVEATGPAGMKGPTEKIFSSFNKKTEWVADITGLISLRVVAAIINEAYFALEEKVSTRNEIDTAMKLGTNYPYGPFEWAQKIGLKNIYGLLKRLAEEQKRYEPSTLLTKEAAF